MTVEQMIPIGRQLNRTADEVHIDPGVDAQPRRPRQVDHFGERIE